jgi:hypothetical protein
MEQEIERKKKLREYKKGHNKESSKAKLKLHYEQRPDGSVYGIKLYTEPNDGHGYTPIAHFYTEFVDGIANAERIVKLWNANRLIPEQTDKREAVESNLQDLIDKYGYSLEPAQILSLLEALSEEDKIVLDFAYRVGRVMDDLRSSNVFFILQQAYGDMDWEEAQGILNLVVSQATVDKGE